MANDDKPYTTKSTAQLDLERRQKEDYRSPLAAPSGLPEDPNEVLAPYAVKGNDTSAYVGVSQEYMTYAEDTQKPLRATEGVEAEVAEELTSGLAFGREPEPEGKQTLGSGSSYPNVLVATSGEDVSHVGVDRKALKERTDAQDKEVRKNLNLGQVGVEPLPTTEELGVVEGVEGNQEKVGAPNDSQEPATPSEGEQAAPPQPQAPQAEAQQAEVPKKSNKNS